MSRTGIGMQRSPTGRQRTRRAAAALAFIFLAQILLPAVALFSASLPATASTVNSSEDGRSQFLVPVAGVPYRFNVSVPYGSVVTSFSLVVSTDPAQLPPIVPADVALDLGLDGVDWSFGGGPEGALGLQQVFADGTSTGRRTAGPMPAEFPLLLPRGATIQSLDFRLVPYVNMSLWNSSEFVTVVQGAAAVPLNVSGVSAPELGDLDGDGVVDLVTSGQDGSLHAYARVGATGLLFNETAAAFSPSMRLGRTLMDPLLRDLDGDGDLDLVVGTSTGTVLAFERLNATQTTPYDFVENTSYFAGITVSTTSSPTMGDLDGDGDLDLVLGAADGSLVHYRNEIGEGTGVSWRVMNTFLGANLSVAASSSPALIDLDGDGDLDLLVGAQEGAIYLFENTGSPAAPSFVARGAFPGVGAPARSTPSPIDWSGDGRPDLFYGSRSGLVYYSKALGGLPADVNLSLPGTSAAYPIFSGELAAPVDVAVSGPWLAPVTNATMPLQADAWGNALETVTLQLGSSHFGEVGVENLRVRYDASLPLPDLASAYRSYAATAPPTGNRTVVPIAISGAPSIPASAPNVEVSAIAVHIDDAPAFLPFPPLALDEDTSVNQLVDLRDYLLDEDAANATFEILSATANSTYAPVTVNASHYLAVDAATGDLNNNWTGTIDVVVRAVDARGQGTSSPPLRIEVRNVEDPPVIEYIAAKTLGPNDVLNVQVHAIDGDAGDAVRFSLLPPSPNSVVLDASSGNLSWNPSSAERMGSAHIVVAATDGQLADTQAFDVFFVPTPVPVFGKPLPALTLLAGRPEFLNIFDYATGDTATVRSVTLSGFAHPFVNLSKGGDWLAFDYPADYPAGSDRVTVNISTQNGDETVSVDLSILENPATLYLCPFPPTPLSRGIVHRVELLRFAGRISDFRNLSFEVASPYASVNGLNLSLFIPVDYPGSALSLPVTVRSGAQVAVASWTVLVDGRSPVPRIGRLAIVAAGARDVDLSYALSSFGIGMSRWPLTTTSAHLSVVGLSAFRIAFPEWPADVAAREWWPIERARIRDSSGKDLLEVELGFDGRSRYIDRVQYFSEDSESFVDGSFALDPALAGTLLRNISLVGTGPHVSGPLENILRLDGSIGEGWRITFDRDTLLEQLNIVGISDSSGSGGGSASWTAWAVISSRDDPPSYRGGAADIAVSRGHTKTVALADLFQDEEGDSLLFALSVGSPGVRFDRVSGWVTVDGTDELNLTDVRVIATESKNQTLFAVSDPFSIRVQPEAGPGSNPNATTADWFSSGWLLPLLLIAAVAAAGAVAFAVIWRREEESEAKADDDLEQTVDALEGAERWEAIERARPPPTVPPAPDDPQMLALEEEWSRVIASRSTDASSAPGDTEADSDPTQRKRAPAAQRPAPSEPGRPAKMTSSDTETERRAGETESRVDVTRRRRQG